MYNRVFFTSQTCLHEDLGKHVLLFITSSTVVCCILSHGLPTTKVDRLLSTSWHFPTWLIVQSNAVSRRASIVLLFFRNLVLSIHVYLVKTQANKLLLLLLLLRGGTIYSVTLM